MPDKLYLTLFKDSTLNPKPQTIQAKQVRPFGLQQPCRMPDKLNLNLFKGSTLNPKPQTITPKPYRLNNSVHRGTMLSPNIKEAHGSPYIYIYIPRG